MAGIDDERVWLITSESMTDDDGEVILLLPGDIAAERVTWFVQELHIARTASDPEKLDSGLHRRVAYPAEQSRTTRGHIHIMCGHNPYLLARLVESLSLRQDEDGIEHLDWTELD